MMLISFNLRSPRKLKNCCFLTSSTLREVAVKAAAERRFVGEHGCPQLCKHCKNFERASLKFEANKDALSFVKFNT